MIRRKTFLNLVAFGFAGALMFGAMPAQAEYPDKPVKFLVPYGPGGATSAMVSLLTPHFEKELGVSIVMVNQGGGGGRVGSAAAARAKPDGYLLLMAPQGAMTIGWQMADTGYTPDSFEPIGIFTRTPMGIAVTKDSPYTSLKSLMEAGKNLKYTTYGIGGALHLDMELFADRENWDITIVGSKGGKEALRKLLSNEVDFAAVAATNLPPFFNKGEESEVRVLAMLEPETWQFLPDAPTAREQGYDLISQVWLGMVAPKGTPEPILARLREATKNVMTGPATVGDFAKFYLTPGFVDHEGFQKLIDGDSEKFLKALKNLGLVD